jgi:hypothetical protein
MALATVAAAAGVLAAGTAPATITTPAATVCATGTSTAAMYHHLAFI